MNITRFEDMNAWKEARSLTKQVYQLTKKKPFLSDWGLSQQIQRSSVSIMNNIAEGFDSGSNSELIRFISYAKRSASEVQCSLYVACDQEYITKEEFHLLYDLAEKIRRMLSSFLKYLRVNGKTG